MVLQYIIFGESIPFLLQTLQGSLVVEFAQILTDQSNYSHGRSRSQLDPSQVAKCSDGRYYRKVWK